MHSTTFTKFRNNAKLYFDRVDKGEIIEIYRHGKPAAILMPVKESGKSRLGETKPLRIPGASLARALLDERDENR